MPTLALTAAQPFAAATSQAFAQPSEPEPTLPAPDSTILAWAASWSEQQVERYLSFYSRDFRPESGEGRAAWSRERRERILRPSSIQVTLGPLEAAEQASARISVSFNQGYATESYRDEVRKTLDLVWEGDAWRIAAERSRPV